MPRHMCASRYTYVPRHTCTLRYTCAPGTLVHTVIPVHSGTSVHSGTLCTQAHVCTHVYLCTLAYLCTQVYLYTSTHLCTPTLASWHACAHTRTLLIFLRDWEKCGQFRHFPTPGSQSWRHVPASSRRCDGDKIGREQLCQKPYSRRFC
jgi:hypothetical protein